MKGLSDEQKYNLAMGILNGRQDTIAALRAENERLAKCLKAANEQAERFEREWYLRGDENERLRKALEFYADANNWSECDECGRSTCYGKVPVTRADGKVDKRYKHGQYRDDEGITAREALAGPKP